MRPEISSSKAFGSTREPQPQSHHPQQCWPRPLLSPLISAEDKVWRNEIPAVSPASFCLPMRVTQMPEEELVLLDTDPGLLSLFHFCKL